MEKRVYQTIESIDFKNNSRVKWHDYEDDEYIDTFDGKSIDEFIDELNLSEKELDMEEEDIYVSEEDLYEWKYS